MKKYVIIVICIISLAVGFFAGRETVQYVGKTEYVKEAPVSGTVSGIEPVSEEKPVNPDLPTRRDTVYIDSVVYVSETVDTAAIIADYELKRQYLVSLFDDRRGKLEISLNTQYNKLSDISYTFVPVRTVQYMEVRKMWQPFFAASYSTVGLFGVGGGLFYNNIGIEYQRQFSIGSNLSNSHLLGLKWKF
ncbi:MAG: hypothetical protein LBK58_04255 [Prevotellaceae bacterium]|jgi:hypothetical protein|nr:hypothetical protein [Prevotellaceae bacterium]